MKKKIIALVLIVLVLSSVFVGCTMFSLDKERDYKQVVGTVTYNKMKDTVYKGELLTMIATYGGMFVEYQGMTYEQATEYLYNDMIKQKLVALYAKEYVAKNGTGGITAVADDAAIAKMKSKEFLTVDELRFCIEESNKSLRKSWKTIIDELIAEDTANKGDQEEEEEEDVDDKALKARPVKKEAVEEETAEYIDMGMTDVNLLPTSFFDQINEEIKLEKDKDSKARMKTALAQMNSNLKSSFSSFDLIVEERCDARIVEKYEKVVGDEVASRITTQDIANSLTEKVAVDSESYAKFDAYNTAMTGEKQPFTFYHNTDGFFNVKSVLFKFSEAQTSALNITKEKYASNEEYWKSFREELALVPTTSGQFANGGLKVNISNPTYDESKDKIEAAYTDKDIDYRVVLYAMAEDIFAKSKAVEEKIKDDPKYTTLQKKLIVEQAKKDAFTDWIYLANDDDGMFTKTSYAVTKEEKASSYVEEYTILARELYKQKASVGVMNISSTGTKMDSISGGLTYEGTTELLKRANGKTANITKETIEKKDDKGNKISTNVYTMNTENSSISFIVNDFGIHIVMIDSIPLNQEYVTTPIVADEKGGFAVTPEYLYSSVVKITYKKDAAGKFTSEIDKISITTKTIDEFIRENLKKSLTSDVSLQKQNELFGNKDFIKQNKKLYDKIVKQVTKKV